MAGLYLHIPFCKRKCRYCDFPSYAGAEDRMAAYLVALEREKAARLAWLENPAFETVFFGGGTPSLLPPAAIARLLEGLALAPRAEITLECNPGTVSKESLRGYRQAGVNRLSVGAESADDGLLARIGRIHQHADFLRTFRWAREAGFSNINVDLMHGLPGQSEADYLHTLQSILDLGPEHISAYALILEEGTPLHRDVAAGREALPDADAVAAMQDAGIALLAAAGYARYEISNFALPGFRCRHNENYWENGAYLGLGAGAHSAWRIEGVWRRFSNPAGLDAYEASAGAPPALETIPREEEMFESIMLGLRMLRGVDRAAFTRRYGIAPDAAYPAAIAALRARGWLAEDADFLRLNEAGLDFQNQAVGLFWE